MKKYKLHVPVIRQPVIPTGPLSISVYHEAIQTVIRAKWFSYPYGLEETISIQARSSLQDGNKVWKEIEDIPATENHVTVMINGRLSSSMSDYRIMSEDKDGNLSRGIKPNILVGSASDSLGIAVYKPDQNPIHTRCPFCHTEVDTMPTKKSGKRASASCIMLAAVGCILCCWIPYILCKDVVHVCPRCRKEVRRYNGLQ